MRTEQEMLAVTRAKAAAIVRRRRSALVGVTGAVVVLVGMLVFVNRGNPTHQRVNVVTSADPFATSTSASTSTSPSTSTPTSTTEAAAPTTLQRDPIAGDLGLTAAIVPDKGVFDLTESITYTIHIHADEGVRVDMSLPMNQVTGREGCNADGTAVNASPLDIDEPVDAGVAHLPGRQHLYANVMVASCHRGQPVTQQQFLEATVGAIPLHNGPALPIFLQPLQWFQAGYTSYAGQTPYYYPGHIEPLFRDRDGFANVVVVDWGDGSAPTRWDWAVVMQGNSDESTRRSAANCHAYADRDIFGQAISPDTPAPDNGLVYGYDPTTTPTPAFGPDHQYATTGSYTITVTAVSSNCDGQEPQSATTTLAVSITRDELPH